MKLLNIKINNLTRKEIISKVNDFLIEPKFHQIATINPEFILEAQKNEEFRNILNGCDLNVADGIGIKFSFWRFGKHLKCRMAGVDLMHEILKIANEKKLKIFLAINKGGLSKFEEIKKAIFKIYPNIVTDGIDLDGKNTSYIIHNTLYNILFCNFGAPYQELFINRQKCDSIRLAVGVGGSFDFLTGKVKRAPVLVCKIGLEWLWRLIQKPDHYPRRWKRIWNAVVVFPVKVIYK